MSSLPDGIVTFIFTDIEGSTKLWESDSELMWRALGRHNAILDQAIANHQGHHFKTIGDAYQIAFASPSAAVAAAVDAQLALQAESWPETGPLRVRMAIHQGEAHPSRGDYLAPCLNRLSRLLSTGFGSQVLLTRVVANQTRTSLPTGVELKDLGRHRLRDLLEPEQVSQLLIPGLPDTFPPLKSLERHPTNLPIQPNDLIGRDQELQQLATLLDDQPTRLITLTGPGGTGKTRLALQLAADHLDDFPDGAFFVDLSPVRDDDLVIPAIAATLGIRESAGNSTFDNLVAYLDGKQLLLLLDNFEQVLPAATEIAQLLARCQTVRVVTTSRAPLNVRGERVIAVEPLASPDLKRVRSAADAAVSPAVQLFVQRAESINPSFALTDENAATVAQISAHLDGLPLAIELAAARINTLSPASLLQRLDNRLGLLTVGARDAPDRQQTLRRTIEWSYDLLEPASQVGFRRLSVFASSFDLEGVEAIVGFDGVNPGSLGLVSGLLDQSLIRRTSDIDDVPRFSMLETLREFGQDALESSGETESMHRAHAEYFARRAALPRESRYGPGFEAWMAMVHIEIAEYRIALVRSRDTEDWHTLAELAGYLGRYWSVRGPLGEGRDWVEFVLAESSGLLASVVQRLTLIAGILAFRSGAIATARSWFDAGLLTDPVGLDQIDFNLGLGAVDLAQGRMAEAEHRYIEVLALSKKSGDRWSEAQALANLGTLVSMRGNLEAAIEYFEQCLPLFRKLEDNVRLATVLENLAKMFSHDPSTAHLAIEHSIECFLISQKLGDPLGMAHARFSVGLADLAIGNYAAADRQFDRAFQLFQQNSYPAGMVNALSARSIAAVELDQFRCSALHLTEAVNYIWNLDDLDATLYLVGSMAILALRMNLIELSSDLLAAAAYVANDLGVELLGEQSTRLSTISPSPTSSLISLDDGKLQFNSLAEIGNRLISTADALSVS